MQPIFDPNRPVYIVGGGASLADFNWNRLYRRQCIAINTAYRKVPWANVLLFSDKSFFDQHSDAQGAHFWRFKGEYIVCTCPPLKNLGGRINYVDPADLAQGEIDPLHCNSGVRAILLAHKLGARKIVLLGFDNVPGHWHDKTPLAHTRQVDPTYYPVTRRRWRRLPHSASTSSTPMNTAP